jgi:DNA replication and repair protein RecF
MENSIGLSIDCEMKKVIDRNGIDKWEFFLNDKKVSPTKLREYIPVVAFSPDDHSLIRGTAEYRRDFLDEVFTDICPGYAEVSERFEKTLKSRNRILKQVSRNESSKEELATWTSLLAKTGSELNALRREVWDPLKNRFLKLGQELFLDMELNASISFLPDYGENFEVPSETLLFELIEADLTKDLATGWTHRGPQRDDFMIKLSGNDARSTASQGQARICALLLKWMHADWVLQDRGEIPLFIIDDLSSELDLQRRKKLLELMHSIKGQIFVSTTEPSLVDSVAFSEYTKVLVNQGGFDLQNP